MGQGGKDGAGGAGGRAATAETVAMAESRHLRWDPEGGLAPLPPPPQAPKPLGLDGQCGQLLRNLRMHGAGEPANHVLLWGGRGCGKSTTLRWALQQADGGLRAVQLGQGGLGQLPLLWRRLREVQDGQESQGNAAIPWVLVLDDILFDRGAATAAFKADLEGGLDAAPGNVLVCATSNRRHLLPQPASENDPKADLDPNQVADERLALADRFGLWLSFPQPSPEQYLRLVEHWMAHFLGKDDIELNGQGRERALAWATRRGHRSGRVARQYAVHRLGEERLGR